jgi:hypothetical protein
MPESHLTLTDEERQFLVTLLEGALKEKLVEEHHTTLSAYRKLVAHQEDLIAGLLRKLGQPVR